MRPPLQPLRSLVVAGRCGVARNNGAGRSHLMATAASVHATCVRLVVAVYCCSSCAWGGSRSTCSLHVLVFQTSVLVRTRCAGATSQCCKRRSSSVRGVRAPRSSASYVVQSPCAVCGRDVSCAVLVPLMAAASQWFIRRSKSVRGVRARRPMWLTSLQQPLHVRCSCEARRLSGVNSCLWSRSPWFAGQQQQQQQQQQHNSRWRLAVLVACGGSPHFPSGRRVGGGVNRLRHVLLAFMPAALKAGASARGVVLPCVPSFPEPGGQMQSSLCSLVALFHQGVIRALSCPESLERLSAVLDSASNTGPLSVMRPGGECSSYFANRFSSSSSARGGASHCVIKCAFRLASSARRGASVHPVYAFRLFCPRPQVVA